MKFELTQQDQDDIKHALENNNTHGWLKMKSELVFEVGDVLIKMFKQHDRSTNTFKWITENIQSDTKMPQRYVYVHQDEHGIGFIKPLRISDGSLGKDLLCLTDFDYREIRFQVDPEYAEHMLLDADFDIKELRKKANEGRKLIIKANRKIGFKPKDLGDFNTFFESLKKGDEFWVSHDFTCRFISKYTFNSKETITVAELERSGGWDWRSYRDNMKKKSIPMGAVSTYKIISTRDKYGATEDYTYRWEGMCFFRVKPKDARKDAAN